MNEELAPPPNPLLQNGSRIAGIMLQILLFPGSRLNFTHADEGN